MARYKPRKPFTVAMHVLNPDYTMIKGSLTKEYNAPDETNKFFGSFQTYGGTETTVNGVYSVIDTANIETWYRPDIKSCSRIMRAEDGALFEVINEPENIEMRNQYLKFKVRRVKGGA